MPPGRFIIQGGQARGSEAVIVVKHDTTESQFANSNVKSPAVAINGMWWKATELRKFIVDFEPGAFLFNKDM